MDPKEKIKQDLNTALKEKKELEVLVLRQLLAAILNKEKEKRYKSGEGKEIELTDEEITEVIFFEVKKRRESIVQFKKGRRQDLVEKEKKELEVLEKYLPEQLSEEEVIDLAKEAIAALRASLAPSEREKIGLKDMGKVMAELIPKIKGKADGNLVSKIVKELLIPKE